MSCCHKDSEPFQVKSASTQLKIPLGTAYDLVKMGRLLEKGFDVRFKTVDSKITPQNRILSGYPKANYKAIEVSNSDDKKPTNYDKYPERTKRLIKVYHTAHKEQKKQKVKE